MNAHTQSDLMDLSNPTAHRAGRIFSTADDDKIMNTYDMAKVYGSKGINEYKYQPEANVPDVKSPNDTVTIYRSANKAEGDKMAPGDYVSFSKDYAASHDRGKMITQQVPAKDVIWQGNDLHEWVYSPESVRGKANSLTDIYNQAHAEANPTPPIGVGKDVTEPTSEELTTTTGSKVNEAQFNKIVPTEAQPAPQSYARFVVGVPAREFSVYAEMKFGNLVPARNHVDVAGTDADSIHKNALDEVDKSALADLLFERLLVILRILFALVDKGFSAEHRLLVLIDRLVEAHAFPQSVPLAERNITDLKFLIMEGPRDLVDLRLRGIGGDDEQPSRPFGIDRVRENVIFLHHLANRLGKRREFLSDEPEHAVVNRLHGDVESAERVIVRDFAVDEVPVHLELLDEDLGQFAPAFVLFLVQDGDGTLKHIGLDDSLVDEDVAEFFFCAARLHYAVSPHAVF